MNGFLLKNGEGVLGLALIDEERKLKDITYLSHDRNIHIHLVNGDVEKLETEIDPEFETTLFAMKQIFVAHFPIGGFDKDPLDEYFVPLNV